MPELPVGTVTFLFTDVEGSTRLLRRLGAEYAELLARHDAILRNAIESSGGVEVDTEGDSFFAAFSSARQAVGAAVAAQRDVHAAGWPQDVRVAVRMGMHTGEGRLAHGRYVGLDVHRAARVAAAAHGGQVLVSATSAALLGDGLEDGIGMRDLGEHRLKDFEQEQRIFQLVVPGLPDEFPPLKSLGRPRANLPVELTSFVGRQREMAAATRLLANSRLVTLTGPGGTGKTRLAIRVAASVADQFEDGVHFVPLAALRDPDAALARLIQVLGVPQPVMPYPNVPTPMARLTEYLERRHLLLVLDNFEQLQAASRLVGDVLAAAPEVRAVVTSRSPLRIPGEQEFPVPPLPVPDRHELDTMDAARASDAVTLFTERARAVRPDFEVTQDNVGAIVEICARLDGLPLAIELAAARVKLLTPHAMLARLPHAVGLRAGAREGPDRQRTLRGAIAWSHDLLDDDGALLFARMAVFRGGARLEAAEVVLAATEPRIDVLDGLASLVNESLVVLVDEPDGEPRFAMLETIHDFALERFDALDERAALRQHHSEHFVEVAEETMPKLFRQDRRRWLDYLERDHDNLRAAFDWTLEVGNAPLALRLSAALWRFWQMRGHLDEGADRVERALALPGCTTADPLLRAGALDALGGIEHWRGSQQRSRRHYEDALAIQHQRGDPAAVAEQLYNLSFTYFMSDSLSEIPRGKELAAESYAAYRQLDDRAGMGRALWALGGAALFAADFEDARGALVEALAIHRELGNTFLVTWILFTVGRMEYGAGNYDAARAAWSESLTMLVESEDVAGEAILLASLADLAWAQGDHYRALRLAGAVGRFQKITGAGIVRNMAKFGQEVDVDAVLAEPELRAALTGGESMSLEEAVELAMQIGATR